MAEKLLLIPPTELSKHYGFPYQTMLNWSKADSYKYILYKILEKNMISEMNRQVEDINFKEKQNAKAT